VGLLWKEKEKMINDVLALTIIIFWLLAVVWILAP
jgi:hypothetical protein